MDVLDKIRCLLSERGWSVYKLSEQSGVAQSTLSNMFNRCNLPSVTTLEAICKGFGITLSEFFSNEEEMIALDAERKQLLSALTVFQQSKRRSYWNCWSVWGRDKKAVRTPLEGATHRFFIL